MKPTLSPLALVLLSVPLLLWLLLAGERQPGKPHPVDLFV